MNNKEIFQFLLDGHSKLEILKFSETKSIGEKKTLIKKIADFPSSKRVQQYHPLVKRYSHIIFLSYVFFWVQLCYFILGRPTSAGILILICTTLALIPFYKNFRFTPLLPHMCSLIVSLIIPFWYLIILYFTFYLESDSDFFFLKVFIIGILLLHSGLSLLLLLRLGKRLFNYQVFSRYSYNEETGKVTFFDEEETISQ